MHSRISRPRTPRSSEPAGGAPASRCGTLLTVSALLLALMAIPGVDAREPRDPTPDARIRYYRARLGARSTYPAYARLGRAYADRARATGQVSDYVEAARHLERSLALQRNYDAVLGLSGVALALHRFPEALAYAREATDTAPGDPAAQGALFDALLGSGDHRAAEQALQGMPRKGGFDHLVRRGALLEYHGQIDEALHDVERACALPEVTDAPRTTRAWCEVRQGALRLARCRADEARAAYRRALAILRGYFLADEHLAELEAATGNARRAAERYRRQLAATSEPRYRLALADLDVTDRGRRRAAGERRRARAEFLRRAAQDVREAWHELALLDAVDPTTAAGAVRWAERDWQNRQDVHAAEALAWTWSQHGDSARAETALAAALAPGGASPSLLLHAALIRLRGGRPDEARALQTRALECPAALTPAERRLSRQLERELAARPAPPPER